MALQDTLVHINTLLGQSVFPACVTLPAVLLLCPRQIPVWETELQSNHTKIPLLWFRSKGLSYPGFFFFFHF